MSDKCQSCGQQAVTGADIHRLRKSFSSQYRVYCPGCWEKRQHRLYRVARIGLVVEGIVVLVALAYFPAIVGWSLLNAFLFCVLGAAIIWAHEAAHAICARLLGLQVLGIRIGVGPLLLATSRWGMHLEIRAWMHQGATFVGQTDGRFYRSKFLLMILAGPMVHVLLLAVAFAWMSPKSLALRILESWPCFLPMHMFVAANLIALLASLLPGKHRFGSISLPSDGRQLFTIPFRSRAALDQGQVLTRLSQADNWTEHKQDTKPISWEERGLGPDPERVPNELREAYVLIGRKQYAKARQPLMALLDQPGLEPAVRAVAADTMARAILSQLLVDEGEGDVVRFGGDRVVAEKEQFRVLLLREGAWYCSHALENAGSLPPQARRPLRATNSFILIEQGRRDEGLAALHEVLKGILDQHEWAFCTCYLALAAAKQGEIEKAERYLEAVRNREPDCVALGRVARELATGT